MRTHPLTAAVALAVFLAAGFVPRPSVAVEETRPERLLTLGVEYPGVRVPPGEKVEMDVVLHNRGRTDETVDIGITRAPEGWKTRLRTYRYDVTGVHVPADSDKRLTFEAVPPEDVAPGDYLFGIEARTRDGRFRLAETVTVAVTSEAADTGGDLTLTTTYPVLRGPTDAEFEFSVEVDNDLDEDTVFALSAEGPEGWEVNFKPAYESKYISSLQVKANQSRSVSVAVKPSALAQAGEYPIRVRVRGGGQEASLDLTVVLTGTYALEAGTLDGRLSLETRQGRAANVSIYVKNTGSAPNRDIRFVSFKPENWKVEFRPETIEVLEPGALEQVEVTITPYEDALVGDYSVAVEVRGEKASKTLEFRTTVRASAAWAWVGLGVIAAVVGGLTLLFRKLGRR
ncbi:MAG: NEW3 domain-containing protein [Deferrisomatales bacterium]